MSDTLYIACVDCPKYLWVGQSGMSGAYLYSTDEARDNFLRFYDKHLGHDMRFVNADGLERLDIYEHDFEQGD